LGELQLEVGLIILLNLHFDMPATFLTLQNEMLMKIHLSIVHSSIFFFQRIDDNKYFLQQFIGKTNCISILNKWIRLMGYLAPSWENQVVKNSPFCINNFIWEEPEVFH
jgi:hypothetical protein